MRILFDQGTPAPLRRELVGHDVVLAQELGWGMLSNGDLLLRAAEENFDLLITTDQNLQYQQNLRGRRIAILVLLTTSWPRIQRHVGLVVEVVNSIAPGDFRELPIPEGSAVDARADDIKINRIFEQIRARACGKTICGLSVMRLSPLVELAKEFSLQGNVAGLVRVAYSQALRVVSGVLHKDLAYKSTLIPRQDADRLAEEFLQLFGVHAEYFTNWDSESTWHPMTDATFDCGVLVVGTEVSGCLWVMDED